jgi:hypothetical protein
MFHTLKRPAALAVISEVVFKKLQVEEFLPGHTRRNLG